ncbi:hypothetical protein [Kamptonema sp. UHCC 0994]|uniref:hypothetical protein n=1 Tax=Kamptonema sp. UHCC 0994 TaxID=3031329 RepID=UPI0023B94101|nr:hypothetical protein [Kamptonema sp. UHCC 0994]MDF0555864.1 hypothetical protein [Kamptonema sp. UHCC 0994]
MKILNLFILINFSFFLPSLLGQKTAIAVAQQSTCPTANWYQLPSPPLSQIELSIPSLWLTKQQFGGKLLDNWFVESNNNWVILIVNRQLWSLLDYLERYQFVNQFGTAARDYGYNVRVCNPQGEALAIYSCKFSTAQNNPSTQLECNLELDSLSNGGLRGKPRRF